METFETLGLKQVVKTAEAITIDDDHDTVRLLSKNNLVSYKKLIHSCIFD